MPAGGRDVQLLGWGSRLNSSPAVAGRAASAYARSHATLAVSAVAKDAQVSMSERLSSNTSLRKYAASALSLILMTWARSLRGTNVRAGSYVLRDMPTTFRPCAPDQSWLFPPSPRDWLPEGHLAFFIADTVAALDLQAFYAPYEGDGRRNQPFDPEMMVTVLLPHCWLVFVPGRRKKDVVAVYEPQQAGVNAA